MATGGVFKLVANDGKADRMLLATALLRQRILDIFNSRKHAGKADLTPTLVDIERTHILYVNAHFKPFAAIGFEYSKIMAQSGTPVFGGSVTFSIPQYGDFFYDIVVKTRISSATPNIGIAPDIDYGAATQWTSPYRSPIDPGDEFQNFVNYCVYPGLRFFKKVSFEVNGNPLDAYDSDTTLLLNKFTVPVNKINGNCRLLGQETPRECYSGISQISMINDNDDANTPQNVIGAWENNQTTRQIAPYVSSYSILIYLNNYSPTNLYTAEVRNSSFYKNVTSIVDGPQTPKPIQPPLELWNKLRFWFNDDVRLAVPSVSIPFGQRFVNIELCQQEELIYESPIWFAYGDVYTPMPLYQINGISVNIQNMEMYINNIFVNPEIHDIYIRRIGFSLIRVYRKQKSQVNTNTGSILLSQLKWPVEYMFVGFQPKYNILAPQTTSSVYHGESGGISYYNGNWNSWRDWYYMSRQLQNINDTYLQVLSQTCDYTYLNTAPPSLGNNTTYYTPVVTVDKIGVTSHGIPIYSDSNGEEFYGSYLPFNYGGLNLNTPSDDDPGCYLINFALFPRSYQPSGHLNISRARETYVNYTSTYISAATPCNFICVAVAINFLLITDGSAILRYST